MVVENEELSVNRQRVLIVLSTASGEFGGTEQTAVGLANALRSAGHEPVLVAVGQPIEQMVSLLDDAPIHFLEGFDFGDVSLQVWRDIMHDQSPTVVLRSKNCVGLQSWRLDLAVRVHGARYLSWEQHTARPIGVDPSVPQANGTLGRWKQRLKLALHFAAPLRTVAVSKAVKSALVQYYGQQDDTISVVYPGVDLSAFRPDREARSVVRKAWGVGPTDFVVGTFGRLVPHKGNDLLLKAVAEVRRIAPTTQLHCLIGGVGPDLERLKQISHNLGIADRVTFAGWQESPRSFLSALDVVCLPSSDEGLGLVLIEGIACGALALAKYAGGMPEIFGPRSTRHVIHSDEPQQWAEHLLQLSHLTESERDALWLELNSFVGSTFERQAQWTKMVDWTVRK